MRSINFYAFSTAVEAFESENPFGTAMRTINAENQVKVAR